MVFALAWGAAAPPATAKGLDRTAVIDLFSEAKRLFNDANTVAETDPDAARDLYQKAVRRFERIVREGGIHNGKLYYNIGNTYFLMGDIGRAILNYRRAQLYIPNDVLLQENLRAARAQRRDQVAEKEETKVLKTLFFWHYDLSARARSFLFAACFAAVWMLAAVRLVRPNTAVGWPIAVTALLAMLMFGSLAADAIAHRRYQAGVIVSDEVVARKGDSETYEKSFTEPLHAGTEFHLLETRPDWLQVELRDGRRCWLPRNSVALVKNAEH